MKTKNKKYSLKVTIVSLTIYMFGLTSYLNAQVVYTKYCNSRYGFCVERPVTFGMDPAPDNNDGRRFYDREGFSMSVYGSYNALEHSLNVEMKEEEKTFDVITYKTVKNNWYVLSGYKDDDIVYIKTYMSPDKSIFYHLHINYPAKFKTEYNEIVSKVSKSFKPSN